MGDDMTEDSDFQLPDEIREPDWSADDSSSSDTDGGSDDSDFQLPPDIREPDWDS